MAALQPGDRVFVCYAGFGILHEGVVLTGVEAAEYIILTPDGDIYVEQLDTGHQDLGAIRFSGPGGARPI